MILAVLLCSCSSVKNITSQGYVDRNIIANRTKVSSDGRLQHVSDRWVLSVDASGRITALADQRADVFSSIAKCGLRIKARNPSDASEYIGDGVYALGDGATADNIVFAPSGEQAGAGFSITADNRLMHGSTELGRACIDELCIPCEHTEYVSVAGSDDVVPSMKYVSDNLVSMHTFDAMVSSSVASALSADANLTDTVESMVESIVENMSSVVSEQQLTTAIDGLSAVYVQRDDVISTKYSPGGGAHNTSNVYSAAYVESSFAPREHAHPYIPTASIEYGDAEDAQSGYTIPTAGGVRSIISSEGCVRNSSIAQYSKGAAPGDGAIYDAQSLHGVISALDGHGHEGVYINTSRIKAADGDIISSDSYEIPTRRYSDEHYAPTLPDGDKYITSADIVVDLTQGEPADGDPSSKPRHVPSVAMAKELAEAWFDSAYEVVDDIECI